MTIQKQVIDYILKRGNTLAAEIDLIVCYGSYVTGNLTELSDVDLFYIPRTDNRELSETFILKGIGYDIFPLSWEVLQDIAEIKNPLSPLLGDSQIIFSHSDKERERFEELKEQMNQQLADNALMEQRALSQLQKANLLNRQVQQTEELSLARELAGEQLTILSTCIAYQNQTYFHKGVKEQYQELQNLAKLPENFMHFYQNVLQAQTITELHSACRDISAVVRSFCHQSADYAVEPTLLDDWIEAAPDYQQAATWYEEVCSSFNKIYTCEQTGNSPLAFLVASSLQRSLKEDLSIDLATKDLMSVYDFKDLAPLSNRARAIERDCFISIIAGGETLHRFESIDELYQQHELVK